ncbi:hypothetical protein DPMN_069860 [Dreissena polymorpha]|uniref:Uncharacterized protein n=1 Tax=Dreissena polymorpha TaxID=45954 RepID=A0A9D3Z4Z8_DREPO|nr:hypothetical protein DPMN_069860 [Dreissena polymorpha]
MPSGVEIFFKVDEIVEQLTLVLQVFINDASAVKDQFHYAPPSSESSPLFCHQIFGLTF